MSESDRDRRGLEALRMHLVGGKTLADTMLRVTQTAVEEMPAAAFASVTMLDKNPRAFRTTVYTDPLAPTIDGVQYEHVDGPCVDACRYGTSQVLARVDGEDARWRPFREACRAHGLMSVLAAPMIVDGAPVGALNVYSESSAAFPPASVDVAIEFAEAASVLLANAASYWSARSLAESLEVAMATRSVIEQAKGVIMHSNRCGSDEAFDLLVAQSQHENRKLNEIASEIVGRMKRP